MHTFGLVVLSCLVKKEQKKKFFRHISLLARREHDTKARSHALTRAMRKKKGRRFAAGTRTLVDRGHYFHLKAGHDNHLHHSEPIRKWYKASFLTCVTIFLGIKSYTVYLFRVFFRFASTAKKFYVSKILSSFYDKRCLSLDPLRRRSLLTRKLQYSVVNRQIERILRPLVPGTLFRVSSFRTRGARGNER